MSKLWCGKCGRTSKDLKEEKRCGYCYSTDVYYPGDTIWLEKTSTKYRRGFTDGKLGHAPAEGTLEYLKGYFKGLMEKI